MNDDEPYLGMIVGKANKSGLDRDRWIEIIVEHANLMKVPARVGINPFTKEEILLKSRQDIAVVVLDGQRAGSMEWTQEDHGSILVTGVPSFVLPLAEEIASSLGGHFVSDAEE